MATTTTWVVSGIIFATLGVVLGWYIFPKTMNSQIEKMKMLRKGTEMRKAWTKFPISLDFRIYLFNVTNPEQVVNGGKPALQEVGPYFFHEWKEKVNLEDDPKEDTVTFNFLNTFVFNSSLSQPLTGEEKITIPHLPMLIFSYVTEETKPSALNVINKAIPPIMGLKDSFLVTETAMNILFDGILLNCSKHKEFAGNAVCGQIRENPQGLEMFDENYFKFSFFGAVNGTALPQRVTVKRGMQNIMEVGQVVAVDGKTKQDIYPGEFCNQIKGTDTTIFPPFMDRSDVWSFGVEICRSLPAKYVKDTDYKGIKGFQYDADLGDMTGNPEEKCFCPTNDTCLKKGAFSLQKCTGAPIILTLPHFFKTHEDYYNGVTGLRPAEEEHGIISIFEPITGTPVTGRRRMQFNVFIKMVPKINQLKNLSSTPILTPLFWIEEGADLDDTIIAKMVMGLYTPAKVVKSGKWALILIGLLFIARGVMKFYQKTKLSPELAKNEAENKTSVTQVSPVY